MSNRNYCLASGIVFVIVAVMHIWRFALNFPLQVGVWYVPRSLSLLGTAGAAVLAVWAFRSARVATSPQIVHT